MEVLDILISCEMPCFFYVTNGNINVSTLTCSDSVTDEVVGTHFIDLSHISNDGANGMFFNFIDNSLLFSFMFLSSFY